MRQNQWGSIDQSLVAVRLLSMPKSTLTGNGITVSAGDELPFQLPETPGNLSWLVHQTSEPAQTTACIIHYLYFKDAACLAPTKRLAPFVFPTKSWYKHTDMHTTLLAFACELAIAGQAAKVSLHSEDQRRSKAQIPGSPWGSATNMEKHMLF